MEYVEYGSTGLIISRLCFGAPFVGESCGSIEKAADLLCDAYDQGVTFFDTAEGYGTQPHVGAAFARLPREKVHVQTKTQATDYDAARASVERSLREFNTDYVDVYLLHAVQSPEDLASRKGALEALVDAKAEGLVRAVGCSTHIYGGPVMPAVLACDEIEVMFSVANKEGRMLEGTTLEQQLIDIRKAHEKGKGITVMKILAAGDAPADQREDWIRWGFELDCADAIVLGIREKSQLEFDVRIANSYASGRRARQQRLAS